MRHRRTLLGGARGRVVEIGAGTGLNIPHYPDGIAELVLIEPEPRMRRRLARRLQRHARVARIVDAPAERLPLADESVDTVISTLLLCTVDDPDRALRKIARVLRPDSSKVACDPPSLRRGRPSLSVHISRRSIILFLWPQFVRPEPFEGYQSRRPPETAPGAVFMPLGHISEH